MVGGGQQAFAPQACAAGELQYAPGGMKRGERGPDFVGLGEPLGIQAGPAIVAPAAQPPLVILGRAGPVVGELFAERIGVVRRYYG